MRRFGTVPALADGACTISGEMAGRKGLTDQECRDLLERLGYPPDDPVRHLEVPTDLLDAIAEARESPTPTSSARARDALARIRLLAHEEILSTTKKRGYQRSGTFGERERRLTGRQCEVVNLVALGFDNVEIGAAMFVSVETVKSHMRHINMALGARNRTHAVAIAMARGYIRPDTAAGLAADQAA